MQELEDTCLEAVYLWEEAKAIICSLDKKIKELKLIHNKQD